MRHQDLIINHRLESWVYPDTASRLGATGFVSGDIGRIAYQSDKGDYYRLLSTTPTWARLAPALFASRQTAQASPAATAAVTPGILLGLNAALTPTATGKVLATACGTLVTSDVAKAPAAQLRFGTGTAPAYGVVGSTGTLVGGVAIVSGALGAPFSISGLVLNAVLGTQLWFDLQIYATAPANALVLSATVTAVEIP
jgi:hypothetical protein